MSLWQDLLRQRLRQHRDQHLERRLTAFDAVDATRIRTPGAPQPLVNFSGNDYLGLRTHPALLNAITKAPELTAAGAGAARLISGNHPLHEQLEQELAGFFQRDAALLFSTGYVANLAVLQALAGRGDAIVQDRLCHASLIDGARLADGRLLRYRHLDVDHCAAQLNKAPGLRVLASDGVFSMDGDQAPIRELSALASQHDALLLIDDAHGIGVLGNNGRGLLEQAGATQTDVPVLIGTFGKAFGLAGAFVTGPDVLIDYLRNFARGWIYSTAPPLPLVAAQRAALRLLQAEPERRQRLHANIAEFKQAALAAGINLLPSDTPIQPLLIGNASTALRLQHHLQQQGFYVAAIRPPTVPADTARLRITISAEHHSSDIQGLITSIAAATRTTC